MLTLEEKLKEEIKYSTRDRKLSERQFNELLEEQKMIYLVPREKMTFIIAHCIYNEAQFLRDVLEDDLKFNDVDIIHIMDGAWQGGGDSVKSTDGTIEIIDEFRKKVTPFGISVIYENNNEQVWLNESVKRNVQLDKINHMCPQPHYTLVKDGDEFVHFHSGRQNLWIKRDMVEWIKSPANVGIINTNAWYFDKNMWGARFLPAGVHYYSEKPMIIHDEQHQIIMNYNEGEVKVNPKRCFKFLSLMFINKWNLRDNERIFSKLKYLDEDKPDDPCTYQKLDTLI